MSFNTAVYIVYVSALLVVCFAASGAWRRIISMEPLERTAAVMAGNWITNSFYVLATGVFDPWWWFLITDTASARLVMYQPAGKAQAAIGWVYMAQIIMHLVYALSDHAIAQPRYWQVLIALAFVQLFIMGGWSSGRWRVAARDWWRGRSGVAAPARKTGVEQ